jgi:hypothetical protein
MSQSGTKLVVALGSLALALGATSWWYRFESAHRATQFWGPEAAELIVESGQVEALTLQPAAEGEKPADDLLPQLGDAYAVVSHLDLTNAPGMVHLRHALTSDSNYVWSESAPAPAAWRWALRFHDTDRQLLVLFTADLAILGKSTAGTPPVEMISCQPMAETLQQYFTALGLSD